MGTGGLCRSGYLAVAIVGVLAQRVAAQGAERVSRPKAAARPAPVAASHAELAGGMLKNLVGTWRFAIWFAGNLTGPADASGTRVVRALFDDLRLEWTEQLDHSAIQSQGILGFDPASDRFFSAAVSSAGPTPEFLTGTLDDVEPSITFIPLSSEQPGPGGPSSSLAMLDQDHFTWVAPNRQWRAVFTRQK